MSKMKKVLIITYYWPPAGGPGVQRVLKFAKYLPQFGWQPIILTVKNGEYPAIDETLGKDISENCIVYKTNSLEPNNFYKKLTGMKKDEKIPVAVLSEKNPGWKKKIANWIRLNLFIPDAKIGWIPFAVKQGKKIINEHKPDIIFSSSPPPTVHLIAKKLAKWSGLKWVADFRDPWTDIDYYYKNTRLTFATKDDIKKEKLVLEKATEVITVGSVLSKRLNVKINRSYHILPNGYDQEDFTSLKSQHSECEFTILYVGNTGNERDPYVLFKCLRQLGRENQIDLTKIKILFIGNISENIKKHTIEFKELKINCLGYMDYRNTLNYILNSNILLLLINNIPDNKGIITSKIFNYLQSGNFILGIGPKDGDASEILKKTNCGKMYNYDEDLSQIILEQIKNWGNGKKQNVNNEAIKQYTRKKLTEKLVNIFEKLV